MLTDEYARRCHAVSRLTALAARHDGIPHNARVVGFSDRNPWVAELNQALARRDSYRVTPRRQAG